MMLFTWSASVLQNKTYNQLITPKQKNVNIRVRNLPVFAMLFYQKRNA